MKPIATFKVRPSLPDSLKPLLQIAYNLCWCWDHSALDLFRRFDRDLWETAGRNPVRVLGSLEQSMVETAASDDSFLAHLQGVAKSLNTYLTAQGSWYQRDHVEDKDFLVAYFSLEFGITECLPIFAGGLGVLAGDHLKAASELGLPLVAIGLLHQEGYFRQYLNGAGWQQEAFEENDFHVLPIEFIPHVQVHVSLPDGEVTARVWRAAVGRIQLYLLDTNIPSNRPEHRSITAQLYTGDLDMRIRQEILLGIGGVRALEALGLRPIVYHMNEGHSAFLALERIRSFMESQHLSFAEATVLASSSLVFTTHTPVPAGHDYFPPNLMDHYFSAFYPRLGLSLREFLALARQNPANDAESFCMTVLALRLAAFSNAVTKLHGVVSRSMWSSIWRGLPKSEVPIGHVSNNPGEVNLVNEIKISASVFLDSMTPEDVSVQVLSGRLDARGEIINPEITPMDSFENEGNSCYRFHAAMHTAKSGFFGYAIRILPSHPDLVTQFMPSLVTWASESTVATPDLALK